MSTTARSRKVRGLFSLVLRWIKSYIDGSLQIIIFLVVSSFNRSAYSWLICFVMPQLKM